jgi:hypothetical protein
MMVFPKYTESNNLLMGSVIVFLLVLASVSAASAAQVTLAWDPNTESDLAGYRIHYGTGSGSYSVSLDVHNVTTYTITGLIDGQTYYFAATAYNASGNSSGFSNEVRFTLSPGAHPPPSASSDAQTSIGVFRPTTGAWYLDVDMNRAWSGCGPDGCYSFGANRDWPVVGDWNGDGTSEIAVFRPSTGMWYLDLNANDRLDSCSIDRCLGPFGMSGDRPVAGDWNGSGTPRIGVFRPRTGKWYLDLNGNGRWDGCGIDGCYGPFGMNGDLPVAGDWSGSGEIRIGVFRPGTGKWYLDLNGNGQWDGCEDDGCLGPFGASGDMPVAGDFNGDGIARIAVFRPSTGEWYADLNGNGKMDNCEIDGCFGPLGMSGDRPVAGKWY